jgi:Ca2+-binding EF-hand superfamily protein
LGERVDRLFKELDRNKDGRISREEAKGQLKRNFDRIDENRDGFIDREELARAALEKPQRAADRGAPEQK